MTLDLLADTDAEAQVIGTLLSSPELLRIVPQLRRDHFTNPRHALTFDAVQAADAHQGAVPDVQIVIDQMLRNGTLDRAGGVTTLHELVRGVVTEINITYHAGKLAAAHRRRHLATLAARIDQAARTTIDPDDLERTVADQLALAAPPDQPNATPTGLHDLGEFIDAADDTHDWLIPGLLERMDRVVVVAGEGVGKSTIARQIVTNVAAGRHPFARKHIRPARTLLVDLENAPNLIRRKTRPQIVGLRREGLWQDGNAWLWSRPGGINLRSTRDAAEFARVCDHTRPHLIAFGPLYKAYADGSDKAETAATETLKVLDAQRERHGAALWVEAHAPLAQAGQRDLRPVNSGVWSRWPEFGLALRKVPDQHPEEPPRVTVERFRGDRDQRDWPDELEHGPRQTWVPIWHRGIPDHLRETA